LAKCTGSLPGVLTTVLDKVDGLFENEFGVKWNDDDEKAYQNSEQLVLQYWYRYLLHMDRCGMKMVWSALLLLLVPTS
jgi:hypothetical protein